jgi:hypothetical protein
VREKLYEILVGNPEGKREIGELGVDGRVILKLTLQESIEFVG